MKSLPLALFLGLLLVFPAGPVAAEDGQVVIEEEGYSPGGVGVDGRISDDGFDVRFRVRPETGYYKRTTITTTGPAEIEVYTEYPGCEPPCDREYCYPSSHACHGCNRYHPSPCPPY
ncbi:MAG: hypothetical protein AB1896_11040 [Thermodesulfobacteriota bacterium]